MEESSRSRSGALLAAEVLLSSALVLSPLAFGTVHLSSLSTMAGLCGAAAVLAAWARPRSVPWPVVAGLALVGCTGLQMVPLPRGLLKLLSPRALELLEFALGPIGRHAVSLDTASTAREFGRLAALGLACFTASRLASDERAARRLVLAVASTTVVQCLAIIVHKTVATNLIYGVVPTTQGNLVLGTFGNANHLAAYLGLGVPLLCALALAGRSRGDRVAWLIAAVLAVLLVMLTGSRSGVLGLVVALLVLGVLFRDQLPDLRLSVAALAGAVVLGMAAAMLVDPARMMKYSGLTHPGQWSGDLKVRAWRDVPPLIHDYWLTGIGRGAFETVFPGYKRVQEPLTFTHAECAPLQLWADFGVLVGTACMVAWVASIALAARREARAHRYESELRLGAAAALVGITVHELGDFSLDVSGAVGLATAVLAGILWPAERLPEPGARAAIPAVVRRLSTLFGVVALTALGAGSLTLAFQRGLERDVARIRQAAAEPGADIEAMVREAIARHPVEPWFDFMAGLDRVRHRKPQAALVYLNRALLLDPTSWRPHQVLAEALLQLGRPVQAIIEFRLAYVAANYHDMVPAALLSHPELSLGQVLDGLGGSDVRALTAFASYLERAGRNEAVVAAAGRLLSTGADDSAARRLLARAELRQRHFAEALRHAEALPRGDPEALLISVSALDGLGEGGKADALLSIADVAGGGEPLEPSTGLLLAERALARRHPAAALSALDRVVGDGLDPVVLSHLYLLRSRALEASGRVQEAIHQAEQAARLNPGDDSWLALAGIYERVGLMREALLVYRGAVRSTPHPSASLRARLASAEEALGAPTISGSGEGVRATPLDELVGTTRPSEEGGEAGPEGEEQDQ